MDGCVMAVVLRLLVRWMLCEPHLKTWALRVIDDLEDPLQCVREMGIVGSLIVNMWYVK